jgi:hypothetical protein
MLIQWSHAIFGKEKQQRPCQVKKAHFPLFFNSIADVRDGTIRDIAFTDKDILFRETSDIDISNFRKRFAYQIGALMRTGMYFKRIMGAYK